MAVKSTVDSQVAEIKFDYIKSNHFRVIHVDGAIGGPTPGFMNIQVNVWSQRRAIPTQIVHALEGDNLGKEIWRTQRDAIVREVEAGLVLDLQTAIGLRDWLTEQIRELGQRLAGVRETEE